MSLKEALWLCPIEDRPGFDLAADRSPPQESRQRLLTPLWLAMRSMP
jgi:hypothetical protein